MALRQCCGVLLSVVILNGVCVAGQPAPAGADAMKRSADRQARVGVTKTYRSARTSADNSYIIALGGIVRWLSEQGAKEDGARIVAEMKKVSETHSAIKDFEKLLAGIKEPKALDALKQKDLAARLKSAGKTRAESYRQLAERCYRANMMGYAYDLVWDMVRADPENTIAWTAINRTKADSGWVTKFEAEQQKNGNVYVKGAGWVAKAHAERVQKGEWFEDGRWMTSAEANKLHGSIAKAWIVETDNFILKSSASRKETMKVAERIEDIRTLCFRRYLEFFTRGSAKKSTELLFNQAAQKKMTVFFFSSQEEFADYIRRTSKSSNKELLLRSAGFYSPSEHASYFYYDANFGPFQVSVMQHEVTHQILGEYATGHGPTWLAEGVAEVLENACYDEHNRLAMPRGYEVKNIVGAAALLAKGKLPPVATVMNLTHEQFHLPDSRHENYLIAGAISCFLLEHQDGVYATDFLEYLHDAYSGLKVSLNEYVGMDMAALDKEFRGYLQTAESVAMKRDADYLKQAAAQLASDDASGKRDPALKRAGKNIFDEFEEEQDQLDKK